jgi:hypothetical protein
VEPDYLTLDGGCIMGRLETAHTVSAFDPIIRRFFADWMEAFTAIIEFTTEKERAVRHAEQSVEEIEGAIMLCRIFGDSKYIQQAKQRVRQDIFGDPRLPGPPFDHLPGFLPVEPPLGQFFRPVRGAEERLVVLFSDTSCADILV